jgi:hypothetical protein
VERDRYLVLTSADIRLLHLVQRICPPAYNLVMRRMNDIFVRVLTRSAK